MKKLNSPDILRPVYNHMSIKNKIDCYENNYLVICETHSDMTGAMKRCLEQSIKFRIEKIILDHCE